MSMAGRNVGENIGSLGLSGIRLEATNPRRLRKALGASKAPGVSRRRQGQLRAPARRELAARVQAAAGIVCSDEVARGRRCGGSGKQAALLSNNAVFSMIIGQNAVRPTRLCRFRSLPPIGNCQRRRRLAALIPGGQLGPAGVRSKYAATAGGLGPSQDRILG
jgi:hypothetical protein